MPFFFLAFRPYLVFFEFFFFLFCLLSQTLAYAHMEWHRTLEECAAGCDQHYAVSFGLRFHPRLWIWHLFVSPSPPITSECIHRWTAEAMCRRISQMGKAWCNDLPGSAFRFAAHVTIDPVLPFTTIREPRSQCPRHSKKLLRMGTQDECTNILLMAQSETSITLCQWMWQTSSRTQEASSNSGSFLRPAKGCMRNLHTWANTIATIRTVGDVTHMPSRIATAHFHLQTWDKRRLQPATRK